MMQNSGLLLGMFFWERKDGKQMCEVLKVLAQQSTHVWFYVK